jgi:hypothetical protein
MSARETAISTETPVVPERTKRGGAATDLAARLAALATCSYDDLRAEWRRLYRGHPPKKISRDLLELGVAWKLQERVLGGPGPIVRRRLVDLAETMATKGDLAKARAVTLRPGARLVRAWHGQVHEVVVVEHGFQWRGQRWRSLTAIAHAITGSHWSGPRFFGLAGTAPAGSDLQQAKAPESAGKGHTSTELQHCDGAGQRSQGHTIAPEAEGGTRSRKAAMRPRQRSRGPTAVTPAGQDPAAAGGAASALAPTETAHG